MEINVNEKERCIRFFGRLDVNSANDLDRSLGLLLNGEEDIILDLTGCSYLSSAGIRILLKTTKQLQSERNELIIAGVVPEVSRVLEIASLTRVLHLEDTVEKALAVLEIRRKNNLQTSETILHGHQLIYHATGNGALTGTYCKSPEVLSYQELGFAIGIGSFSGAGTHDSECPDMFGLLGNCIVFIPESDPERADFRITSDPVTTGLPVCEALSFGLCPTGILQVFNSGHFPLNTLFHTLREVKEIGSTSHSVFLAVVINRNAGNPSVSLVLETNAALTRQIQAAGMEQFGELLTTSGNDNLVGITCRLAILEPVTPGTELMEFLKQHMTFENILNSEPIHPGTLMQNPVAWLFQADFFEDGSTTRLAIHLKPGATFKSPNPFLARLLYTDSSTLDIIPLHGGYSAQTYHVTSYDFEGRKMRPTVMKVAHRNLISRESERCQKYALPYIFNNCAVVLGSAHYGETMAIRYNFVGIGGEASQLKWLAHYYQEKELDFLEPIFDKVFLQILTPWYGQPVKKTIYPFHDHDPTFTFFPHIYETVNNLFSISADEKYLTIPEIVQPILNPYWFLKHEYSRNREWGLDYLTGICHGDLNMQNILLDENMNVYLIDFSETRPRSIVSDFARQEAIFMIDNAPIDNDTDMTDYLDFIQGFYTIERLDDIPEITYTGKHHGKVFKNAALTLRMRSYAFNSAQSNPDPIPYFIALLEWVLPIVCFTSLPVLHRRLSMIVSSFLAEKVLMYMPPD